MTNVIFVTHSLEMAGAERLVVELASRLPAKGFETSVVTVLSGGALEHLLAEGDVRVFAIPRRGFFGLATICALYRAFRAERPEIVHTHLFLADTWGRLAAWLARVPVIVSTEHNVNPTYGFFHRLTNALLSFLTDAHIAVSGDVKAELHRVEGVSLKKIRVILNGIDLGRVVPRGTRPFRDVPRLITVGRLHPQKDHATLLKALALIKRPWRLQIVGVGPLEGELRALAERLHLSSRIEWLGAREDVPELLAASDAFCFPSRYEGFGLAAVEAAAAGVPMIASDLPPLREILAGDDALFPPSGDVSAWADAIRRTLDDPTAAVLRANRAVPKVAAAASLDRMVEQHAKLYRELLKKAGRRVGR
ncbi:glycosyltransferase [Candidatus Uhrbacteria bacterium]|nr:glycosyltransferase [Candidatus Uhrbacteria bacterium]